MEDQTHLALILIQLFPAILPLLTCFCFVFQLGYTVLKEADIKQRQEDDISKVSTVLSISRIYATILLRHYNW